MSTVLIELPDGDGVVRRDDGEIVVTQDVRDDRGQPLCDGDCYRPVKTWLRRSLSPRPRPRAGQAGDWYHFSSVAGILETAACPRAAVEDSPAGRSYGAMAACAQGAGAIAWTEPDSEPRGRPSSIVASMTADRLRQIKIGEWLPADDPVALFVTTVAMLSNDLLRLVDWMLRLDWTDADGAADRLFSFRVQAAAFCEASKYLRETPPRWPAIQKFVSDLGPDASEELARVQSAGDPKASEYLGQWLTDHRNLTFHYAEMHPERVRRGLQAVSRALADAALVETALGTGHRVGDVRYAFADAIAMQWLPDEPEPQIAALRERIMDVAWFVQRAVSGYMASRATSVRRGAEGESLQSADHPG